MAAQPLVIGNSSAQNLTWDGQIDEFILFPVVLTTQQMTNIITTTGA